MTIWDYENLSWFKSGDFPGKYFVWKLHSSPRNYVYFDSLEELCEFVEDYTLEEIEAAANFFNIHTWNSQY